MQIVIRTQVLENYGAHDWDGEGQCPQRWKCKGGHTVVIPNVDADAIHDPMFQFRVEDFMETLCESNDYYEEYHMGYEVLEDCEAPCPDWERDMVYWVTIDDEFTFHVRRREENSRFYIVDGYSVNSDGKEHTFFRNVVPLQSLSDGTRVLA